MADGDIEVSLDEGADNTAVDVVIDGAGKTTKTAASPSTAEREAAASLKQQLEGMRRQEAARAAADQRAIQEQSQRAQVAEREVLTTKKDAVVTVMDSLKKDSDAAKRDYRVAMESGDYEKAADAQERIALASARLVEAEKGRQTLEEEIKQPLPQKAPVRQAVSDPVEQFVSTLSTKSAEWIRAHPECVTDQRLQRRMMRAHEDAMDDGITVESPQYFAAIEARLGMSGNRHQEQPDPAARPDLEPRRQEAQRAPLSAPIGRDGGAQPGRRADAGTIRLSAEEVKFAESSGVDVKEYARQKAQLLAEGRIGIPT